MTTYVVNMDENMAEKVACAVLRQVKKDTADGGVMEACEVLLTYLTPPLEGNGFKDSGFTDEFGIHME